MRTIKNIIKNSVLSSLLVLCFNTSIHAAVIEVKTDSFEDIQRLYQKEVVTPEKTLLVFDIDDTLMTMSQSLGSIGWWDWQNTLLKNDPNSEKLIVHSLEEFIKVQNILYNLITMDVTDSFVLPFLKKARSQNTSLMALTARGSEHLSITLTQLKENAFLDSRNQLLFKAGRVDLKKKGTDSDGLLHCPQFKHQVVYHQGIVFLKGEDKGEALRCIISHAKKAYNTVFFVDDAVINVMSVTKAFAFAPNLRVFNILYTAQHQKEALFLNSSSLQNQTDLEWKNISKVIKNSIGHSRLSSSDFSQ